MKDDDVFAVLTLGLRTPPQSYSADALSLRLPFFFAGKTFDVTIAGTRGDSGADEVRSLYATVIPGMHPRDLFVFFQRARFVAGERMARVGNNFAQVSVYDLQAVFKPLETARELAYQRYFQPDAAVNQAAEWFRRALAVAPPVALKGVGGAIPAQQLLKQLNELDGVFFGDLYQNIKPLLSASPEIQERGCRLLRNYKNILTSMPAQDASAVLVAAKLDQALIEAALAQCLARSIANGSSESVTAVTITTHIHALETARAATETSRKLVGSAAKVLRTMSP